MHLVDDDEPHAEPPQRLDERPLAKPLRGRVEDSRLARGQRAKPGGRLLGRERRVHEGRGAANRCG
jgi:hypothetical protein